MHDVSEEIRRVTAPYLRVVGKSGAMDLMAICPFHRKSDGSEERTPSFAFSLTNGLWYCHSCHASGNLYTFLKEVGVDRTQLEALYRPLIDAACKNAPQIEAAVKIGSGATAGYGNEPLPESLLGIFDFYPKALVDDGYTTTTLSHFDVGFDKHNMRITYPLRDVAGQLVGISGRAVTEQWPRYKVYNDEYREWGLPARGSLNKSHLLWNVHALYPQLMFDARPQYLVAVEGFKACMWLWQSGIRNVVALLGSYMSREHVRILERLGVEVRLFLDNNDAGKKGTELAIKALKRTVQTRVIEYPARLLDDDKAQPDNLTVDEVTEQVETARNSYFWQA